MSFKPFQEVDCFALVLGRLVLAVFHLADLDTSFY